MKKIDVEKKLRSVYSGITPDVFDNIISECENREQESEEEILKYLQSEPNHSKFLLLKIAGFAIVFINFFVCAALIFNDYKLNNTVSSIVAFDVNPSFRIQVNEREKVIKAEAVTQDAAVLLDEMDLKNVHLNVAVNAIIGSMLKNGYLSELQNSILITVQNDDAEKAADIQNRIMDEVEKILQSNSISGAIVGQTNNNDAGTKYLAQMYNISEGKAELIQRIISSGSVATFDQLAKLSINELNLIVNGNLSSNNITATGKASESLYIGEQRALEIAVEHAGLDASDIINSKINMDYENNYMVYEVEFVTNKNGYEYEYEYEINAVTGDILEFEQELKNYYQNMGAGSGNNQGVVSTHTDYLEGYSEYTDHNMIYENYIPTGTFD